MKMSDMIFADGKITDCVMSGDTANNRCVLQLSGALVECDAANFGCSVHHHKLGKGANGWSLELFDDDNEIIIFSAGFSSVSVLGPLAP